LWKENHFGLAHYRKENGEEKQRDCAKHHPNGVAPAQRPFSKVFIEVLHTRPYVVLETLYPFPKHKAVEGVESENGEGERAEKHVSGQQREQRYRAKNDGGVAEFLAVFPRCSLFFMCFHKAHGK